ncbi:ABC transporter permease [Mycoplasmopsis bovigenitalium]|uniref:YitT family protein n=1 Tax=Mycoplasmopsis bovigenitalium TaxID=2112 RepID=UPI00090C7621|nr:YitT family protein [Mycoplasmopsis bovigenitalium]BAW18499.1 ABC transporter permease [Mycoplasmopsis bovigenitalium]
MNTNKSTQKTTESSSVKKLNQKIKDYKMGSYVYGNQNPNEQGIKKRNLLTYLTRTFFMFVSALLFSFGVIVFLQRSETIPSGLSGIPMLITLVFKKTEPYFALMYLGINIPLFCAFATKIKKTFILHTLEFMIFQIIINFALSFEFNGANSSAAHWLIKVFNVAPGWSRDIMINGQTYENPTTWPILVNGAIGSIFVGASISLAWKFGGSTGGTDIVAYYFSTKKQKSVGSILSAIALMTSITFLLIFAFAKPHNNAVAVEIVEGSKVYTPTKFKVIVGMREVTSFLYIAVVNLLVGLLYPKYKKVEIQISCSPNSEIVLNYFKDIQYWHAFSIEKSISGFSNEEVIKIKTTMLYLEARNIIKDIRNICPNVWISVKPVHQIIGKFNTQYVDES